MNELLMWPGFGDVDLQLPGPGASRLWAYDAPLSLASGGWIPGGEGASL